jgi:sec-independent protein translocase protein TatB
MPDVSLTEFAIIGLVVLIAFGPKRLPEISRTAGKWARELRTISREFRQGIEREVSAINEPLKEITQDLIGPMQDIEKEIRGPIDAMKKDLAEPLDQLQDDLKDVGKLASADWVGPVAESGPTPGDALEDLDRIESGEDLLDGEPD